jgi:hypothetical protein
MMAENGDYEQRRQELLQAYEQYLGQHGGAILLSPDVTVRLDFLNMTQIENRVLLERILAQLGGTSSDETPGQSPGGGTKESWEATEPEQIFSQAILSAGNYYGDRMIDWTRGKRLVIKAESSLSQAVQIQVVGNTTDTKDLATDIGPPLPCPANGNISVGLAWDDWHPYIGIRIEVAVAPTAGLLTISAVIQE